MKPVLTRRQEARGVRLASSQPESAAELLAFLSELRARLVEAVLDEPRVRARLDDCRHALLAVDYREDKAPDGERAPRLAEVAFYDYEADVLVVAVVDPVAGALLALDERRSVAPPIAAGELVAAKRLAARAGERTRSKRAVGFPTPRHRLQERRAAHRCCTLYVPAARGGGVAEIVVDLSAQELVPRDQLRSEPSDDVGGRR